HDSQRPHRQQRHRRAAHQQSLNPHGFHRLILAASASLVKCVSFEMPFAPPAAAFSAYETASAYSFDSVPVLL
ncbi:MAG TPA: hypothetical protein VN982_09390, partial [Candidatus Dormibacteraeota bacterium]|nr:hypothetical protein [Candidatus Dormibacteraeota bacterium]